MRPPTEEAPSTLARPAEGAHVYGMFMDGARWDFEGRTISGAAPKVLYYPAPMIWPPDDAFTTTYTGVIVQALFIAAGVAV